MLTKAARPGRHRTACTRGPIGRRRIATRAGAVALLAALGAALAGCAGQAEASAPPIELVTAYVGVPHDGNPTDAYVAIRNNGNADQLVSVRTSVGGTVTLRGPAGASPDIERDFSSHPDPRAHPGPPGPHQLPPGHQRRPADEGRDRDHPDAGVRPRRLVPDPG